MGFISALSPNYLCLMALRFLVGVGVVGGHVFSSWFLEFVPAQNRGTWMIVFSFFWTLGTVLEASLAWVVLPALSWRWLLGFTAVPCFLLLPFFGITPESPRYLCAQNRMSDATLVLERISKTNQEALPAGILTYNHGTEVDPNAPTCEIDHLLPVKEKKCTHDNAMSSKSGSVAALRSLLSRNLRRSTLLLWFVFYANTFAYYGLVLLTSQLSDANRSCASGLRYTKSEQDTSLYKDTFITSLAEFPGLIVSAVLVEWLGRKATMWCLLFTCCGFLGPLMFHQTELWTTALLFGARACAMGSFTVLCLYAPEVYPTSVRSTGVGIANAIGRIGGIVCPLVAVGMLRSCHQMEAILVFEVVLCLAAIACMMFPVETKGRDMN
ncbi:organic cation/carnitine transporter 7-like isoform X2 [Lolium perenne]|uniref:organic cation/carnitine transporter 7-like isoform X2 n=1 Tax=Lolium perenne TaxID=4522 RepID=UPI0021F55581|nr:organic cation/carnitine transporter 7-like isoform X3 [Lolium perenne]